MPLELGTLLNNRYRLTHVLGQGAGGAVYLANDESRGGRPCVVKQLVALSPEAERLFRREASLLANVNHPNLPRVTDHFAVGGEQYLVMDYVEGQDLQQRLARQGPLPEGLVLRWAAALCEAVRYLHSLVPPIVHRDIKPANIKVTPDNRLVLVDFGVARPADSNAETPAGTATGFAPPEQYGVGRMDGRSDQYAVAATLYTLLVGQAPPDSVERLLGNARLPAPRDLRPDLSERTAAALVRGLEVRPEDRFPDMLTFTHALQGTAAPEPPAEKTAIPSKRPPAPAEDTIGKPRAAAPPPTPVLPPAAVQPTIAVPVAVPATPPIPPAPISNPQSPISPAPSRPRSRAPLAMLLIALVAILAVGAIAIGSVAGAYLGGVLRGGTATPTRPPQGSTPDALSTVTVPAVVVESSDTPIPTDTLAPESTPTETPVPPTDTPEPPTLTPTLAGTPVGSGGRLAFISDRNGTFQIYTMRADGGDVQQLTTDPADKWDPAWTFGGTQLAWSPDGTQLLYVAASPAGNGTDLWLINADGTGAPVNITAAPGDDFHPTWCGDGSIWFASLRANNTHQIFTTTLADYDDGIRPRNISGTHNFPREYDPVLLPDGDCQRLMFVTTLQGRPEIWRYFLDCANCYRVVRTERDNNGAAEEPALSADGVYIAYTRRLAETAEIVVGEVLDRLVNVQVTDTGANSQPQFSPDGQWLVFTSSRDGNREIYLMARDGAGQTNLTQDAATDTDPVWQPVALP